MCYFLLWFHFLLCQERRKPRPSFAYCGFWKFWSCLLPHNRFLFIVCGVRGSDKLLFCKIFKNDGETFDKSQDRKSVYMSSIVKVLHSVPLTAGTMPFVLRKEYAVIWLAVNRLETENRCYYHHGVSLWPSEVKKLNVLFLFEQEKLVRHGWFNMLASKLTSRALVAI
jgi:hypothetical protein